MSMQNLSQQYLNNVNDALPGGAGTSGTGAPQYLGQVGHELELDAANALRLSNTSVGTLYGGKYQYVNVRLAATQNPAIGQCAYWYDRDNYIVTPDVATGCFAGIFINAITKGNYGYIQTGGLASVKFKASVTKATPAACDLVVNVSDSSVGRGDVLADATALTSVEVRAIIGTAAAAPVSNTISTVQLWERYQNPAQNIGG